MDREKVIEECTFMLDDIAVHAVNRANDELIKMNDYELAKIYEKLKALTKLIFEE